MMVSFLLAGDPDPLQHPLAGLDPAYSRGTRLGE